MYLHFRLVFVRVCNRRIERTRTRTTRYPRSLTLHAFPPPTSLQPAPLPNVVLASARPSTVPRTASTGRRRVRRVRRPSRRREASSSMSSARGPTKPPRPSRCARRTPRPLPRPVERSGRGWTAELGAARSGIAWAVSETFGRWPRTQERRSVGVGGDRGDTPYWRPWRGPSCSTSRMDLG